MPTYAELTPGQKAAHTTKWRRAADKAHATGRNAKTFAKYALGKAGWRVVRYPQRARVQVVDLVAVKRNNRAPDEFELLEEARQVCITSATNSYADVDILLAATDYVQTIGRVARKHHGGTLPKPFSELAEATYGHVDPGAQYRTWDAKQCSKIVEAYIPPLAAGHARDLRS